MLFSGSGDAPACLVSGAPSPPLPPPLQASEAALLYLGDGGQQSWISAPSHLCSPFLLFHADNKPLRSVSVWRLSVLNLGSDAASSSTCLCWRRRTKNYCWEMTETLKKLCSIRIYCIVAKGDCESADCRRSLHGGLRLKLLLGIHVWDQPLSPGLLPKITSSIKGHEATFYVMEAFVSLSHTTVGAALLWRTELWSCHLPALLHFPLELRGRR